MYVVQAESLYTTLGETNIYNYFGKLFSSMYYICICITYNPLIPLHEGDHYRSIHNFTYFMGKWKISKSPSAIEYITKMCNFYICTSFINIMLRKCSESKSKYCQLCLYITHFSYKFFWRNVTAFILANVIHELYPLLPNLNIDLFNVKLQNLTSFGERIFTEAIK